MCEPLTVLRSENKFAVSFASVKMTMDTSLVAECQSSSDISARLTEQMEMCGSWKQHHSSSVLRDGGP